jgi:DNA-binding transcriptional ArsR family regulator
METQETIFIELFGDYPLIRILNQLLMFREFDYSLTDIAKNAGVAWSTLNLIWPKLEGNGIVVNTRKVGKAKMYKLNLNNSYVAKLVAFVDSIVWEKSGKQSPKRKILVH